MYSWNYFISLPGIKDLDPREQARQFFIHQSNAMLEASNNSLAPAAAAAAGSGGGGLTKKTSNEGVLFMDNLNSNYEFFVVDEKGVKTNRVNTGIVANDWYENNSWVIQSKGYVIEFRNEEDNNIYQFLFVRADGTIAGSKIIQGNLLYQYDQRNGKYFYYNELTTTGRDIVYFDGDEIYTHTFDANNTTARVAWNANTYIYETEGFQDGSSVFTDNVSASGLIVYDDRDSDINKKWYSLHKGTITELFQEDNGHIPDTTWDFQSSFVTNIRWDNYYSDITFYSTETGNVLQTLSVTASEYQNVDSLYYGTGKFSALFYNNSEYLVVTYDGVTNQLFTKTVERIGTGEWDFFCSTKTPSLGDAPWGDDDYRNFISENIVFVFQNNGVSYDAAQYSLYYWTNISLLGVFDGATQSDLVTLDGYGVDTVNYGSGAFTENKFSVFADSTGTSSNNTGQAAQLIIDANGYTFSNFGPTIAEVDGFNLIQLDDAYVYKIYQSGSDIDEYQKFGTNGQRLMTATFSPAQTNYWNTGKLFRMEHYYGNTYSTYFTNDIIGNSPSSIEALGLTVSKAYRNDSWTTYYNTPDNINDGKVLLAGDDYTAVDNFVLLTGTTEPVYLDFSYIFDTNNNIYLCKTFIIVQYQDGEGNGFAKTYDYDGNITQELSFGQCEWISSDSVVGDLGVIRFTNWGTTKRVFLTKDTYYAYDLEWDPYYHWTIFNDYYWWRD